MNAEWLLGLGFLPNVEHAKKENSPMWPLVLNASHLQYPKYKSTLP